MRIKEWVSDKVGPGRFEKQREKSLREGSLFTRSISQQELRRVAAGGIVSSIDEGILSLDRAQADTGTRYNAARAAGDVQGTTTIASEASYIRGQLNALLAERDEKMKRYNIEAGEEAELRGKYQAAVETRDRTIENRSRRVEQKTASLQGKMDQEKSILDRAERQGEHLVRIAEVGKAGIARTEERLRAEGLSEWRINARTREARKTVEKMEKDYERLIGDKRKKFAKAEKKFFKQKEKFNKYETQRRINRSHADLFEARTPARNPHLEVPKNHLSRDYRTNIETLARVRSWPAYEREVPVAGMLADWNKYASARKDASLDTMPAVNLEKFARQFSFDQASTIDPRDLRMALVRYYINENVETQDIAKIIDDFENRTLKDPQYDPIQKEAEQVQGQNSIEEDQESEEAAPIAPPTLAMSEGVSVEPMVGEPTEERSEDHAVVSEEASSTHDEEAPAPQETAPENDRRMHGDLHGSVIEFESTSLPSNHQEKNPSLRVVGGRDQ